MIALVPDEVYEPERHWWQLYPEMWAAELAAFKTAGLLWEQDVQPEPKRGTARMLGKLTVPADSLWTRGSPAEGIELVLTIAYPSSFPWFAPSVWARDGQLPWLARHRSVEGHLCLMHDEDWRPGMTTAGMLAVQLPRLLAAAAPDAEQALARADLAEIEIQVPEPSALHSSTGWSRSCLVDSGWEIPAEVTSGYLLTANPGGPILNGHTGLLSPGYVARVYDHAGVELAGFANRMLPQPYLPLAGRWLRLDAPPERAWPRKLFEQIQDRLPDPLQEPPDPMSLHALDTLQRLQEAHFGDDETREAALSDFRQNCERNYLEVWQRLHGLVEVVGLLHPDELTWRTSGWAWTFLLRSRTDRRRKWTAGRVKTGYAGPSDLRTRAPHAETLATTRVTIVGAGAIGSRVAEGLAQAGVGALELIDHDTLQPGNLTRHVAGMRHVGQHKVEALIDQLHDRAPQADVEGVLLHLGSSPLVEYAINGHGLMQHHVRNTDMIIDAAANPAVTRYLAALCLAEDTPFLHVSGTAGGWGGTVVRIDPHVTPGCWSCLEHHRADGTIPVPPADPADNRLHPVGCAEPTFTGAAADLDTIALHAVRVITDRLAGSDTDTELLSADVFIATLHTVDGPVPARWEYGRLTTHPGCPVHGTAAAAAVVA
jgi:molybdopterin/thiamine biosynthesis adenylyltransferase